MDMQYFVVYVAVLVVYRVLIRDRSIKVNENHYVTTNSIVLSLPYLAEIPEGCGGHHFLTNMEKPRRWGVLSEISYVLGYGYFLETHSGFQMLVGFWIP